MKQVKFSKLSSIFILFIVAHLNLVMPVSKASGGGDICITDNGVHMASHSDNQMLHDHRGYTHHSGHRQGINKIKADCNMDMSSSDIYFPGGEHPFTYNVTKVSFYLSAIETVSFSQIKSTEGFFSIPYNPPRFIS